MSNNVNLDLGKFGNSEKIPGMLGINSEYPAGHTKEKTLIAMLENCEKSAVKYSNEKPTLLKGTLL